MIYPVIQKKIQHGIILAAGFGTRFNCDQSKTLIPVNKTALIIRTIRSLEQAGCHIINIVLGWQAESVQKSIEQNFEGAARLRYLRNPDYHLQNGISVLCAKHCSIEPFFLSMADHIFDDKIMEIVSSHTPPDGGATLCVDYKINTIFDLDDATKVQSENGRVISIGKNLETYNCIDTGLFIATHGLMDAIERVYSQKKDASLSEGVQLLAKEGKMTVLDIGDCFWQDVDTPEMLQQAEKLLKRHQKTF